MKSVFCVSDLADREKLDAGEAKPARLAVIGWPVAHSASPQMHQPALDALGIPARYIRLEVEEGQVEEAFAAMQRLGFVGCNVTVPHKLAALNACEELTVEAKALGAVNTVIFREDGTRLGHNTDGPGMVAALEETFGQSLREQRVMIVGAGGAGQAVAAQCVLAGVRELVLVNRSVEKLQPIWEHLQQLAPEVRVKILALDAEELIEVARNCDCLINTTSLGLKANDASPLPEACFAKNHAVYDSIYKPAETKFLALAKAAGAKTGNGLTMLLHQGNLAFQRWFPGTEPLEIMREALFGAHRS